MTKKSIFRLISLATIFLVGGGKLLPLKAQSKAGVNLIQNYGEISQAANQGLADFIVVSGNPTDIEQIKNTCQQAQTCLIRGHQGWTPFGEKMAHNPEEAAQAWKDALKQLTSLGKQVYFEPWNEPDRDYECGNKKGVECARAINRFLTALLAGSNPPYIFPNVILTTPAIDLHISWAKEPERAIVYQNTIGSHPQWFGAVSVHAYSVEAAQTYTQVLNSLNLSPSLPVFFTEIGTLKANSEHQDELPPEENISYFPDDLCREFCQRQGGLVNFLKGQDRVKGYALFSHAPGNYSGPSFDLWSQPCVQEALQGNCDQADCQSCQVSRGVKGLAQLVKEVMTRPPRPPDSPDKAMVSFNLFPGPLGSNPLKIVKDLFGVVGNSILSLLSAVFRLPRSLYFALPDLPDRYPEDTNLNLELATGKIEFHGTVADVCVPPAEIAHLIKFFPTNKPEKFAQSLLNITSIHHLVFRGLDLRSFGSWYGGYTFNPDKRFVDIFSRTGPEQLILRGVTNRNGGMLSKRMPGEFYAEFVNKEAVKCLLLAADPTRDNSPQKRGEIACMDYPLAWACAGKGLLVESDFPYKLPDGRIDRTRAKGCQQPPIPIRPSHLFCCNPDFFKNNPYAKEAGITEADYQRLCQNALGNDGPNHWSCNLVRGMETTLYSFYYFLGTMANRSLVSHNDLPVYVENCLPASRFQCLQTPYSGFFIDLPPDQRGKIYQIATDSNPAPSNQFFTKAEGKCWKCQIAKVFLPNLEGAIDACSRMARIYLPQEVYQEKFSPDRYNSGGRVTFPCDLGNQLPGATGPLVGKDNADYQNVSQLKSHDLRGVQFISEHKLSRCKTYYDEEGVPSRCQAQVKLQSRMRIYIERYDQIRQCVDFLYGVMSGETGDQLEKEIRRLNPKVNPRDLPVKSIPNSLNVYSGLENCDRKTQWNTDPNGLCGQSFASMGPQLNLPGQGALELPKKVIDYQSIPGEFQ